MKERTNLCEIFAVTSSVANKSSHSRRRVLSQPLPPSTVMKLCHHRYIVDHHKPSSREFLTRSLKPVVGIARVSMKVLDVNFSVFLAVAKD